MAQWVQTDPSPHSKTLLEQYKEVKTSLEEEKHKGYHIDHKKISSSSFNKYLKIMS